MSAELVVANVQMTSIDDVESNLTQMDRILKDIFQASSPRLVCFPENCLYMRLKEGEKIPGFEVSDPLLQRLARWAQDYNTYLHLGSVPILLEGHLYNSSALVNPEGLLQPTYQKMHLFDIQLEGQAALRESDAFRHGQRPNILEIDGWKVGEAICYDIRFAELFSQYARKEVDLILVPAAFLMKTGEAHWNILLRARAIESQAYILASAQGGQHQGVRGGTRETYGHSLTVDPWGVVLGEIVEHRAGFVVTTLTREKIERVRAQIPMKFHRRLPVG